LPRRLTQVTGEDHWWRWWLVTCSRRTRCRLSWGLCWWCAAVVLAGDELYPASRLLLSNELRVALLHCPGSLAPLFRGERYSGSRVRPDGVLDVHRSLGRAFRVERRLLECEEATYRRNLTLGRCLSSGSDFSQQLARANVLEKTAAPSAIAEYMFVR
jgi:hypothetical protein